MTNSATWRWIRSGATDPAFNMALDEAILRCGPRRSTLRTYGWEPWTVSLGYFQDVPPERVRPFADDGYGVVRRSTGGGAIFHADELTYSLVCPADEPLMPRDTVGAYDVVHGIFTAALARFGVHAEPRGDRPLASDTGRPDEFWCFYRSSAFDLAIEGRKLLGSAQRRTRSGFLMHGSLPTSENAATPEAAFAGVSADELETALGEEMRTRLGVGLEASEPTPAELELAAKLARERYGSDRWTWRRGRPFRDPGNGHRADRDTR